MSEPKLYSVCVPCDTFKALDHTRHLMDLDICKKCGMPMDVWTAAAMKRAIDASRTHHQLRDEMVENCKVNDCHRRELTAEIERLRGMLTFLIEEIIDREGREGMTDFDFAEQVIALAQTQRAALTTTEGR